MPIFGDTCSGEGFIYIYIYIYIEVDKSVSLQRCIAFSASALIFCCKAHFGCRYDSKFKYWTHRPIFQYYTITLNRVLTQRQIWYAMHDSKSYCTRKMAASQSGTVHSKTHRFCPIHTRNIGPIGPLSSTIPSPWIKFLPKGRSHMHCMIQRATVQGKWLRPNQVRFISWPTVSVLSTQEILDPSVLYAVPDHLEWSPYPMGRSD